MKIAFYANEITKEGDSGVKTYSKQILNGLLGFNEDKNIYQIYSNADISSQFSNNKAKFTVLKPRRFWAFTVFAKKVLKDKPDLVFLPIQTYPFLSRIKPKTVVVVHDLAFLLFPKHFTFLRRKLLAFHTKRAVKLSTHIIVPSKATKNDILKFYKVEESKISVVFHGFSDELSKNGKRDDARVLELTSGKDYMLFVGSFQPRKNINRLVEAFEGIRKSGIDIKLVLCGGKGWLYEDIYKRIEESPFHKDIIVTGNVSDELLSSFYKNAKFFVFPSLYEGFGLPIIEAMSFSLPVCCSDNSSISEVAGDSAMFFNPYRTSDMQEKLAYMCSNKELRGELAQKSLKRSKEFSWKKSAKQTLDVIENVIR